MLIFKTYKNSALATFISILSAIALLFGGIGIISFFTAGMKDSSAIVLGLIFVAVWFVLSKGAKAIAEKKGK